MPKPMGKGQNDLLFDTPPSTVSPFQSLLAFKSYRSPPCWGGAGGRAYFKKESFCIPKRVLLLSKRSPFALQNESFCKPKGLHFHLLILSHEMQDEPNEKSGLTLSLYG